MTDSIPSVDCAATDRYRELFENSADPILIIEQDKFVDCNQAAVDMLRYKDKSALLQRHPSEISPEYQPDGQRSFEKANKILANAIRTRNQRFEWIHVTADGELFPVEVLLTVIPTGNGYNLNVAWRDLTEQKRLEKELRHSQRMEVIGNFAGGIAHDFNNMLVPILAYSDTLFDELHDRPEQQKLAHEIHHACRLASNLVKKLLAFSRKGEFEPVTFDLRAAVDDSLHMLDRLVGENVSITVQSPDQSLWIRTDAGDIEQILSNLASNARDAMPEGGEIRLSLSLHQEHGKSFARLEIVDQGEGMEAATLEQIFVPFYSTKGPERGTGLGMSMVYGLVTKAAGLVNIQSEPGAGTSVEVLFPLALRPYAAPDSEALKPVDFTQLREAHVLVVEDDPQVACLVRRVLEQEGCRVSEASDGIKALEILDSQTPDVILTDVIMSQMSGPLLYEQMQARGIIIPVLFMSAFTDNHLAAQGFDAQKISLLRKPFTPAALLAKVHATLSAVGASET